MVRKVEVAADTRQSDDFLIVARTDARTALGLDAAIERANAYRAAGADLLFVESPESLDELRAVRDRVEGPLVANMVNGGRTPLVSAAELHAMGYALAIHPAVGFLAAGAALRDAYADLARHGETSEDVALYPFSEFNELVGFDEVWAFEQRFPESAPDAVRPDPARATSRKA
jgi:2-methylisocitrate lyase-like PEP mutase family enzyme